MFNRLSGGEDQDRSRLLQSSTEADQEVRQPSKWRQHRCLLSLAFVTCLALGAICYVCIKFIWPPIITEPVGPYQLIASHEGSDFFEHYTFYEGQDTVGSDGYLMYVNQQSALELNLINVTTEEDETFVYMSSSPTDKGPRNSVRLEGKRRFDRGLFVIDVRHLPAGCGVWPAFWLTDEENWPTNGEIDIVESFNYQSHARTALHSAEGCVMDEVADYLSSGGWDIAVGIPDPDTGEPDMTLRNATNCFVYAPHQWTNQGCVAVDLGDGTLGNAVNDKGGAVYALEWDPSKGHIRTWVFSPHSNVPENLRQSMVTSRNEEQSERVMPDPTTWSVPYGYFAIGEGTKCSANHFKNMQLVLNLAFCGSVAGNRYQIDCPTQAQQFDTCNDWIASVPEEMNEAYWKIRGVYIFEREMQ